MKNILLALTLLKLTFPFAQCPVSISNNGLGCVGDTLNLNNLTKHTVTWKLDNTTLSTTPAFVSLVLGTNCTASTPFFGFQMDSAQNIYLIQAGVVTKYPAGTTTGTIVAGGNGVGSGLNQLADAALVFPIAYFRPDICFDKNGYMYVADAGNHRVIRFPPGSNQSTNGVVVAGTGVTGSASNQLNKPTDVWVDTALNIYVADAGNYRVQKFMNGSTTASTIAGGNGNGTDSIHLSAPLSILLDANNNLYVSDAGNNRVLKFNTGSLVGNTVAGGNGQGSLANQLYYPEAILLNTNGDLFVADASNSRVQKFAAGSNQTTNAVTVAGGNGTVCSNTTLGGCCDIHFGTDGYLYVGDGSYGRVLRWTPLATSLETTQSGTYTAQITGTSCNAFTSNAITIKPNRDTEALVKGKNIFCFNEPTISSFSATVLDSLNPTFEWRKNNVVIGTTSNINNYPVQTGDSIWVNIATNYTCASAPTGTSNKVKVSVLPDMNPALVGSGNLCSYSDSIAVVGQSFASRIQFDITTLNNQPYGSVTNTFDGKTVAGGNGVGTGLNQFNTESSMAVDNAGNIYIADYYNHRVLKFPAGGNQTTFATVAAGGNGVGSAANQLYYPNSVAIDKFGNIYVSDKSNFRVQKFPPGSTSATNGITVAGGNGPGPALNQITSASSIAVDSSLNLYVLMSYSASDYILRFPNGSTSATYGVKLIEKNSPDILQRFALDKHGNIYTHETGGFKKYPPNVNTTTIGQKIPLQGLYYIDNSDMVYYPTTAAVWKSSLSNASIFQNTIVAGGTQGSGSNQLNQATHVAVDQKGYIYVLDQGNYRVQKWSYMDTTTFINAGTDKVSVKAIVTDNNGCKDTSNSIQLNPPVTPTVTVKPYYSTSANLICSNLPNKFLAMTDTVSAQNTPVYQWKKNGVNVGTNSSVYEDPLVSLNDSVWVSVTSSYGCNIISPVTSNKIVTTATCQGLIEAVSDSIANIFDTITVKINVHDAQNIYGLYANLFFDTSALKLFDYNQPGFLGANVLATPPIVSGNKIDFGVNKIGSQTGTAGSGLFYTFRFVVYKIPPYPFDFGSDHYRLPFRLTNLTINNDQGAVQQFGVSMPDTTLLRYYIPVWPGDLNNDKNVNVADLLPIGYFYNKPNYPRPNASLQWIAQPAISSYRDIQYTYSLGYVPFADGNGDGQISLAEQTSIGFNIGKVHALSQPSKAAIEARSVNPPLVAEIAETQIDSTQFSYALSVKVKAGDVAMQVDSLLGIAFDLFFDPECVDTNDITTAYSNLFGTLNSTYIKLEDFSNKRIGKLSIGITRYNVSSISLNGDEIVTVNFKLNNGCYDGWFNVKPTTLACNNDYGKPIALDHFGDSVRVIKQNIMPSSINDVADSWGMQIIPNPATNAIQIQFNKPISNIGFGLSIFDITGKLIGTDKLTQQNTQVDVSYLVTGIYFVKVKDNTGQTAAIKLLKQ